MGPYDRFVHQCLTAGDSPNDIVEAIHEALVKEATDWAEWGDGRWRLDMVCSTCGSELAGVCGHQDQPEQRRMLRRDYRALKGEQ